ncbi:MAG: DUF3644 domain-containing protein [Clostridiaceae bacterium]
MKSRANELLDRSLSAMISAIEIYNKPNFYYRGETFAILAINSWELAMKAKWLIENKNRLNSLYVYENRNKKGGGKSKKKTIKQTRSGNPYTHNLDTIAEKLVSKNILDRVVLKNLQALIELRDSAIHFYNYTEKFTIRLQEIGTATLKNYVTVLKEWFDKDLSDYNFYLMPLSFISPNKDIDLLILNSEEKKFFKYIEGLESDTPNDDSRYSVTLNVDVKFTRSKTREAINVAISDDPDAIEIRLTEEQIRDRYPWDYHELVERCKSRYSDFKANKKFYDLKSQCLEDKRYVNIRLLDPDNSNSSSKCFYNGNIFRFLDKHYNKR